MAKDCSENEHKAGFNEVDIDKTKVSWKERQSEDTEGVWEMKSQRGVWEEGRFSHQAASH